LLISDCETSNSYSEIVKSNCEIIVLKCLLLISDCETSNSYSETVKSNCEITIFDEEEEIIDRKMGKAEKEIEK